MTFRLSQNMHITDWSKPQHCENTPNYTGY